VKGNKMKRLNKALLIAIVAPFLFCNAQGFIPYEQVPDRYYEKLNFDMPKAPLPQIPNVTVSITDYGAVGDGIAMNTAAINNAIEAIAKKGGGRVIIPPGLWLTGPILMKSNVDLHLEQGAVVVFSPNIDDTPFIRRAGSSSYSRMSLIYGEQLNNIAITGKGVFNGNGQYWHPVKKEKLPPNQWKKLVESGGAVSKDGTLWMPSQAALDAPKYLENLRAQKKKLDSADYVATKEYVRPDLLVFYDCSTILIDGPVFVNSPKFTVHPTQCSDVIIRNMSLNNEWWAQNGDGIDLSSCRNVLVYNNVVNAGDDGICVKPGVPNRKTKDLPACENIIIADCIVYHAHGGFVIGSESYGNARNINVRNLTCIWTDVGLRFKSARGRGGLVENIVIDGVWMKDISKEAILFDMSYGGDTTVDVSDKSRVPEFRNITMNNIRCDGASIGVRMEGLVDRPVNHIALTNATLIADRAIILQDAQNIQFTNIDLRFKQSPVLTVRNVQGVDAQKISFPEGTSLYVRAEGTGTRDIRISQQDAKNAKKAFEVTNGATNEAIIIK
jgi:polygalacturonase